MFQHLERYITVALLRQKLSILNSNKSKTKWKQLRESLESEVNDGAQKDSEIRTLKLELAELKAQVGLNLIIQHFDFQYPIEFIFN